jgi:cation-transporting ATPase E
MAVAELIPVACDRATAAAVVGALAAADRHPNATLAAIAAEITPPHGWDATTVVPFSSSRKWSGASFAGHGDWVMGAPEVFAYGATSGAARRQASELAGSGGRVLMVGRVDVLPTVADAVPTITPIALVVLRERLRPDAAQIIAYYIDQGLSVKLISGDNPATVGALAASVGVPGGAAGAVSGADLPAGLADLGVAAEATSVFGRVGPQQKRDLVRALQARGHVVAMTGDGVNDVLALKAADIGIAMGSGSTAARAVARLTLLHDSFASVPFAINEGRRVIANLERVATFFLTKTVYAMVLAAAVAVRLTPYPLLPRQLSLVGLLAVGVPAFALSFAHSAERARPGFVSRTLTFAIPAGVVAGVAAYAGYELALARGSGIDEARTVATVVLLGIGLWIVGRVARPLQAWKLGLLLLMAGGAALAFSVSATRNLYGLSMLSAAAWLESVAVIALSVAVLEGAVRISATAVGRSGRRATRDVHRRARPGQ